MGALRNRAMHPIGSSEAPTPSDLLTAEEVGVIKDKIPLKIYEPVIAASEIVITGEGDIVINWGGEYAS